MAQAKAGDEHAFAGLVRPLRDELVIHAYRMLGSLTEAEDCVQESLTRAWRGLGGYEENGTFRAWLYRIVTNRCLTALGRSWPRELPADLSNADAREVRWLEPLPDSRMAYTTNLDPEARAMALESVELAFLAAIQQMPPRQRAVLLLRDVLGFTTNESALLLDMSVPAINSALQRARRLRDARTPTRSVARPSEVRDAARRYVKAWEAADVEGIVSMLVEEARYSMPPLPQVFTGAEAIREFLLSGPLQRPEQRWRFLPAYANGQVAFGTYLWDGDARAYLSAGLDLVSFTPAGQVTEVVSFLEADFAAHDLPDRLFR